MVQKSAEMDPSRGKRDCNNSFVEGVIPVISTQEDSSKQVDLSSRTESIFVQSLCFNEHCLKNGSKTLISIFREMHGFFICRWKRMLLTCHIAERFLQKRQQLKIETKRETKSSQKSYCRLLNYETKLCHLNAKHRHYFFLLELCDLYNALKQHYQFFIQQLEQLVSAKNLSLEDLSSFHDVFIAYEKMYPAFFSCLNIFDTMLQVPQKEEEYIISCVDGDFDVVMEEMKGDVVVEEDTYEEEHGGGDFEVVGDFVVEWMGIFDGHELFCTLDKQRQSIFSFRDGNSGIFIDGSDNDIEGNLPEKSFFCGDRVREQEADHLGRLQQSTLVVARRHIALMENILLRFYSLCFQSFYRSMCCIEFRRWSLLLSYQKIYAKRMREAHNWALTLCANSVQQVCARYKQYERACQNIAQNYKILMSRIRTLFPSDQNNAQICKKLHLDVICMKKRFIEYQIGAQSAAKNNTGLQKLAKIVNKKNMIREFSICRSTFLEAMTYIVQCKNQKSKARNFLSKIRRKCYSKMRIIYYQMNEVDCMGIRESLVDLPKQQLMCQRFREAYDAIFSNYQLLIQLIFGFNCNFFDYNKARQKTCDYILSLKRIRKKFFNNVV